MKTFSITCAALLTLLTLSPSVRADSGFIIGAGGGVAFGFGDNSGNGGFADGELGYEWVDEGGVATTLALGLNYTEVEYDLLGSGGRTLTGRDDVFTVAPRVRVALPIDETFGFYMQGQVGVNISDDVMSEFGWGAGAGIDIRLTELLQARVGYLVIGDTDGNGYHGVLAAVTFKF
jgi:opacity protein-like surface antigen